VSRKKSTPNFVESDLAKGEVIKFHTYEPISSDEIVDLHVFLANKSNELTPLF
jgi:hypothetical protein